MNVFDVVLILLILLSLFTGWKIRSSRLVALIIALAAGALASNHFQARLLDGFQAHFPPATAAGLAWLTPFLITGILVFFLGMIVAGFLEVAQLQWLDHLLGALLACGLLLLVVTESIGLLYTRGGLGSMARHRALASGRAHRARHSSNFANLPKIPARIGKKNQPLMAD